MSEQSPAACRWTIHSAVDRREAAPYALVGVDRQRDVVAKLLHLGEDEKELVVTITGSVGMGKTTLAHEVYRMVGAYFDCRAWVSASPSYRDDLDRHSLPSSGPVPRRRAAVARVWTNCIVSRRRSRESYRIKGTNVLIGATTIAPALIP